MRNFSAEEQIRNLGLEKIISNKRSLLILDVGCGKKMNLLRHLRRAKFNIEGIDGVPSENYQYLINQNIVDIYPNEGSIPRENNHYDLVIAHQNPFLNSAFTCIRKTYFFKKNNSIEEKKLMKDAEIILNEMERVTKKSGIMIIYPALDIIHEDMNYFLNEKGIKVINKKVIGIYPEEGIINEGYIYEDCLSSIGYRTILLKDNSDINLLNLALEV